MVIFQRTQNACTIVLLSYDMSNSSWTLGYFKRAEIMLQNSYKLTVYNQIDSMTTIVLTKKTIHYWTLFHHRISGSICCASRLFVWCDESSDDKAFRYCKTFDYQTAL